MSAGASDLHARPLLTFDTRALLVQLRREREGQCARAAVAGNAGDEQHEAQEQTVALAEALDYVTRLMPSRGARTASRRSRTSRGSRTIQRRRKRRRNTSRAVRLALIRVARSRRSTRFRVSSRCSSVFSTPSKYAHSIGIRARAFTTYVML